jgi:heat shock protein HslJ
VTPENGKEVNIVLTKEDSTYRLKGYAGCNSIGGSYTRSDNNITFTVMSTKMFCDEGMEIENFLIGALEKTNHFKISGDTLSLYHGDTFLAKFESVYFK